MYRAYRDKIKVVLPTYFTKQGVETPGALTAWKNGVHAACLQYHTLLQGKIPQRVARSVLPLCTAVELYATANLRQWRHFFEMRCSVGDHEDMQKLVWPLFQVFENALPEFFKPLRDMKGFYNGQ